MVDVFSKTLTNLRHAIVGYVPGGNFISHVCETPVLEGEVLNHVSERISFPPAVHNFTC